MIKQLIHTSIGAACLALVVTACKTPALVTRTESREVPAGYTASLDSTNSGALSWREFFTDPHLTGLIETALKNNQELAISLQEIDIARNEIRARQGEYLPFVGLRGGVGEDKASRYTLPGASVAATEIRPGKHTPDPLPNLSGGVVATWELDIWHRLRNAKKAALNRYLASVEGRNFAITNLVAEIAGSYYELLALDNELEIVRQTIDLQTSALRVIRIQKEAAKVSELAVRRFEAQVLNTQNLQYGIRQRMVEAENRVNFLTGRFPQPEVRRSEEFNQRMPATVQAGVPAQLLVNRPDIRRAEQELLATKLDVKVAKARFYPTLGISAGIGLQAFNPAYLLKAPESLILSLAGELAGPLINKNAIIAAYNSANARQIQAVYNYERAILNAYIEVANQLSRIKNFEKSYEVKAKEVQALTQSVAISNTLFNSARADYMEVLLTQRDAQESRFDLVETRKQQLNAMISLYRALGGGWK